MCCETHTVIVIQDKACRSFPFVKGKEKLVISLLTIQSPARQCLRWTYILYCQLTRVTGPCLESIKESRPRSLWRIQTKESWPCARFVAFRSVTVPSGSRAEAVEEVYCSDHGFSQHHFQVHSTCAQVVRFKEDKQASGLSTVCTAQGTSCSVIPQ